jgi:hypothetical protein
MRWHTHLTTIASTPETARHCHCNSATSEISALRLCVRTRYSDRHGATHRLTSGPRRITNGKSATGAQCLQAPESPVDYVHACPYWNACCCASRSKHHEVRARVLEDQVMMWNFGFADVVAVESAET